MKTVNGNNRIAHEKEVIRKMITIYCRRKHVLEGATPPGKLCRDCSVLLQYAYQRLERCPKGEHKNSCRKCEIHCYSPVMKMKIRDVMRYVGPRMIYISPVVAVRHLISELR